MNSEIEFSHLPVSGSDLQFGPVALEEGPSGMPLMVGCCTGLALLKVPVVATGGSHFQEDHVSVAVCVCVCTHVCEVLSDLGESSGQRDWAF